jgi:hypothetical protein
MQPKVQAAFSKESLLKAAFNPAMTMPDNKPN